MDFSSVVRRAREVIAEGAQPVGEDAALIRHPSPHGKAESSVPTRAGKEGPAILSEEVYGRVCSSSDGGPPLQLSSTARRRSVFLFGPDTVEPVILKKNAYDILTSLGFDRPYIHHEVMVEKSSFWLALFKPTACVHGGKDFFIVPATWEGVAEIVRTCYPLVFHDLQEHWDELTGHGFGHFEREAGFNFIEARKNISGSIPGAPPFHSYDYFAALPRPRQAWQVRAFLYCEMRLLRLFQGDGYTCNEQGERGTREYLCPNIPLSHLESTQSALIPMNVVIPE